MLRSIQILRGLAALGVVLDHIRIREGDYFLGYITPRWFALGEAGVDLFFVISGFIMVYIQPGAIDSPRSWLKFIIHRFTRIFPPLWLVLLALTPVWLAQPQLFNNYCNHQVDVLRSFFLLPQEQLPLLAVAWTLTHEIYFYLAISLVLILPPPRRWLACLGWFLTVWLVFACFGKDFNSSSSSSSSTRFILHSRTLQMVFSPFSLTFLLGSFLALALQWLRRAPVFLAFGFLLLGLLGLVVGFHLMPPLGIYPDNNHLFRFWGYGVSSCLLVAGSVALETRLSDWISRLQYLGDRSYALYLVHFPVVAACYAAAHALHLRSSWMQGPLALACFLICLLVAFLFHDLEIKVTRSSRKSLETLLLSDRPKTRPAV